MVTQMARSSHNLRPIQRTQDSNIYMHKDFCEDEDADDHCFSAIRGIQGAKMLFTDVTALILVIVSAMVTGSSAQALPGCPTKCGDSGVTEIPYPFGIGKDCAHSDDFLVNCNYTTGTPMIDQLAFINISIPDGQMCIQMFVAKACYINETGVLVEEPNVPWLRTRTLTISSTKNKFIAVGCDTYGFVVGYKNNQRYETGCRNQCQSIDGIVNGTCNGIACCQVDIPSGWENITLQASSFDKHKDVGKFNPCSFALLGDGSSFKFSTDYLRELPDTLPLVLDWAIGGEKCESISNTICKANSHCVNLETRSGYLCKCNDGFEGNPYLPDGCHGIDFCTNNNLNRCIHKDTCKNVIGNYTCSCTKGFEGDGRDNGSGCHPKPGNKSLVMQVAIGASVSFVAVVVGISWLCLMLQKRKLMKLKETFFRQNGGLVLKQQLSKQEGSTSATKIFTAEELKKATNNYDEKLVLGRGGYGTVFRGVLADNSVVAIKKSKIVDQSQIEQFVNEVVVLSQINHRNVVKLLGCCLETEVPLLVYEYVNNGTLYEYIHKERNLSEIRIPLATRLRIAAETAGALSYLHSAASVPIIHRDVKTANILLDDSYTAKVSDFGASRLIPVDQTELATMVQGTLGYLDPEYMLTSQLTEKSDVYSFGVVLIELLTAMKPLSFDRPGERRSLAMYFLSCLKEDQLLEVVESEIVSEGNIELVREVAILAARCLRVKGDERPSMKEVAMEIEGILRMIEVHPWVNIDLNREEGQYLLHEVSGVQHCGDSSNGNTAAYDSLGRAFLIEFDGGR